MNQNLMESTYGRFCIKFPHVCKWIETKLLIFIEDLPRILPNELRFIWPSNFREEDFLEINQSETRIDYALGLTPQFLAHLAKGNVSFCHHLESIVRPLSYVVRRMSSVVR
jgi:hypothetical protein